MACTWVFVIRSPEPVPFLRLAWFHKESIKRTKEARDTPKGMMNVMFRTILEVNKSYFLTAKFDVRLLSVFTLVLIRFLNTVSLKSKDKQKEKTTPRTIMRSRL